MSEEKNNEYIFKQTPLELIINEKDSLELSNEVLKLFYSLKNQKVKIISINGLPQTGKTSIANDLISKENGFNFKKSTNGLWIWGTPINLKNNIKLLIIDSEGIRNNHINNYNLLSLLISNYYIYNTKVELNEDIIKNYINNMNVKNLVNYNNNNHFPEIIFINDILTSDEIKKKVEENNFYINNDMKNLYKIKKYFNIKNIKEIIKDIENNFINDDLDGDIIFGLIQNYLSFINHNEKLDIGIALENSLLSKAKLECDNIFEENKKELYKKIEYPLTINNIYKIYNEIQTNYIYFFSKKVDKILKPSQLGDYIVQLNNNMEKEINFIINKNHQYYETYFLLQFKDFKKNLDTSENLKNLNIFQAFIADYCGKFENCLHKFFSIFLNSDNSNKTFINILIKLYQEYIVNEFIKISKQIEITTKEINSLKNNMNKLNEELQNTNLMIEEKNREKSTINKNYFELEAKFDKFNREYKIKIKEYENNLNIEIQKYKKMENYYLSQLKEKEQLINNLENKIEKFNQELQTINKENIIKLNELNRENNHLLNEIERIKDKKGNKSDFIGGEKNVNIPSLLKTVNKSFLDFKESLDNLQKENDSIQKNKYLEISTQEIENKLNNVLTDVKNFCNLQIKNVSDNYEKIIKKIKNDSEELNFELSKKNYALNEQILLKETYEKKFNESNKYIDNLNSMVQDKENLIKTQKNAFKTYEERINDSEMKMHENIINLKMKEDEFESLFMVIENLVAKRKDKFEHDLNKISLDGQEFLKSLVKKYKVFK